VSRGSDTHIGPGRERMEKLDAQGRGNLHDAFWTAIAPLNRGSLFFPFPFDMTASVGLARNRHQRGLAFGMFAAEIRSHVREFDITIVDLGGEAPVTVIDLKTTLAASLGVLQMCEAAFKRPPGKDFRYRVKIDETGAGMAREIVDTVVTHPVTATGLLDEVFEALLAQDEGEQPA
jgi:hypothetical protein